MALPPVSDLQDTFVREVDEELRRDDLSNFWNRYGKPGVALIVAVLIGWGGWLFWEHRTDQSAGAEGEQLVTVGETMMGGADLGAEAKLMILATSKSAGTKTTAELTRAALAVGKADERKARSIYQQVAADEKAPQPLRDLATVRLAALDLDTAKPDDIVARLKPYAAKGNPWFGSAGEMSAIALMRMGKDDLAGKMLADVAEDEKVPDTVRSRAVQLANALGAEATIKPVGDETK